MPPPSPSRTVAIGLLLFCAACERQAPAGAEAAAHAAERPKPTLAALTPQSPPIPPAGAFVARAAAADASEIAAGRDAHGRARDPAVRGFAAMMVHDHADSAAKLEKAVAESGQALSVSPAAPAELRPVQAPAEGFDKAYLQGQIAAHQATLALMQAYAQNGDVPALQAFAGEAAVAANRHLQLARDLAARLP